MTRAYFLRNRFSDGSKIDWFIWEPVETVQLLTLEGQSRTLGPAHWQATIFDSPDPSVLNFRSLGTLRLLQPSMSSHLLTQSRILQGNFIRIKLPCKII